MTNAGIAAWLLSFKGPHGKLAKLETLYRELDMMDGEPAHLPSGMGGGGHIGISDPTARDAVALLARRGTVESSIAEVERELFVAMDVLGNCPHGAAVGDYYLDASGNVTWMMLATDLGITERTMQRWRDETVDMISNSPLIRRTF